MGVEGVTIFILLGADFARSSPRVNLENGVGGAVDVSIDAHAKQMLVIVGVDTRIDFCTPAFGVFTGVHGVGIQDPRQFDLELHRPILMKDPVHCIFIVRRRKHVGDDQFAASGHDHGVVTEIGMFEKNSSVFFMDTDSILDGLRSSSTVDEMSVEVLDRAFAVATQGKTVGHVAASVLPEVESMLALMRMLRITVRHHHFSEGQPVEDAAFLAPIIIGDVVQNDTFAIIESDMDLPILPHNDSSIDLKVDAFRLGDVDGLDVLSVASFHFDCFRVVIVWRRLIDRSANRRDIDVNDFLSITIEDWSEIQGERILAVVYIWPVIHQRLL